MSTPTSSSKIPRWIKAIHFKGEKHTTISIKERYKPSGTEEVITEEAPKTSDQPRHGDLDRAMQIMKVHLITSLGFSDGKGKLGEPLDAEYFAKHLYENDSRFSNVTVTGVIITSKETSDQFQVIGTIESDDKQVAKLKSFSISTIKSEGTNYVLADFAKSHIETLLFQADEYRKGKSSLGQLKMALVA